MSERMDEVWILDVVISIDFLNRYSEKIKSSDELRKGDILSRAFLGQLVVMGVAMSHILKAKKLASLVRLEWQKFVDLENVLRREYYAVNYDEVFRVIKQEIPQFEQEFIEFIKKRWHEKSMQQEFEIAIDALSKMKRDESVAYLTRLKKSFR